MSSETRKRRRKRHHVKQHATTRRRRHPSWSKARTYAMTVLASAALTAGLSTKVYAGTMPVPSETAWAQQGANRPADRPAQPFDIPSGPLSTVVPLFERATGMKVAIAVDSIGMITSPGVTGTFTPQDALAQLLAGTNVTVRFTAPTAAVLELRLAGEAVEVTAAAPAVAIASPKYTQPLRDIPQTIEVIPRGGHGRPGRDDAERGAAQRARHHAAGRRGRRRLEHAGDMFNMRGFNAANSLFVDDVRDDGLVSRDVFNLEQVEVFMGPTGSDVGRGTAAGYVNMQTKTPHLPAVALGQRRRRQRRARSA